MDHLVKEQEDVRGRFQLDAHVFNVYQGEYGTAGRVRVASMVAISRQAVCLMLIEAGMNPHQYDIRAAGLTSRPISFDKTLAEAGQ